MSLLSRLMGIDKPRTDRRHIRRIHGAGIRVKIDSHVYPVGDLSGTGLRVENYDGSIVERQAVHFELHLMVANRISKLPAHGVAIRMDPEGLAIRFSKMQPYYRKMLEEFVTNGEISV